MNKDKIIQIIEEFKLNEFQKMITDEKAIQTYQKVLSISVHVTNACSIILSSLSTVFK